MVTPGPCLHRPLPARLRRATFSPRRQEKDRAAQAGNAGGPPLDGSGKFRGIVSAKLDAITVTMAAGNLPPTISFAVKSAITDVEQAMSGFVVCQ